MGLSKVADAVVSGFASGCLWRLGLLAFFTVLLVVLTVLGLPFMLLGGIGGLMVYIVIATVVGAHSPRASATFQRTMSFAPPCQWTRGARLDARSLSGSITASAMGHPSGRA